MRRAFAEVVFLVALAACTQKRTGADALRYDDCVLGSPSTSVRVQARCASLDGVKVAVLPAEGGRRAADPLFFIPGGPGQSGFAAFAQVANAFALVRRHRDIVVIEPRGTGLSEPLTCKTDLTDDLHSADAVARLRDCAAELGNAPSHIGTVRAVRDIDMVRAALGYETINIYAASYGTRVALQLVKTRPDAVRSMVLDGVLAPETSLGVEQAEATARALRALESRLAPALPERTLGGMVTSLSAQLAEKPISVRLRHPVSGLLTTIRVDERVLEDALRMMLYQSELAALIPTMLRNAELGDVVPLASHALLARASLEEVNPLVYLSVVCAEDVPFWPQGEGKRGLFGGNVDALRDVCEFWPVTAADAALKSPVTAETPTLLLSGSADPVTPPSEAEKVARHARHARSLTLEGQGHIGIVRGCVPRLAAEFLDQPWSELDTACAALTGPLPFFTGPNGP